MHTGIDVSGNQGSIDFKRVAAEGYRFVYIKATEGATFVDHGFEQRQRDARNAGLHTGFYHFLRPRSDRDGAVEADFFYNTVKGVRNGGTDGTRLLRLVADVEITNLNPQRTRKYTAEFLIRLQSLASHEPIIYTFPDFMLSWVGLTQYRLWIANYEVRQPKVPAGFNDWTIWQFTSKGHVAGVNGRVDLNKCPELTPVLLDRERY